MYYTISQFISICLEIKEESIITMAFSSPTYSQTMLLNSIFLKGFIKAFHIKIQKSVKLNLNNWKSVQQLLSVHSSHHTICPIKNKKSS